MTPEEQARERRLHEQTSRMLSTAPDANGGRTGILDLTAPGRALRMHQTRCARRFILRDNERPFDEREASLLAMHPMGTGKTITAIACIAGVYKMAPRLEDFVAIVVAPKSVLATWCETMRSWTTLGDKIVLASKEADLTAETFHGPVVIVTTKDVVLAARKTYMYWDEASGTWTRGIDPKLPLGQRARLRASMVDGALPTHPLFAHVEAPREGHTKAITFLCFDEAHKNCDPATQYGGLGAAMARGAIFVLGLSGTPVTSEPAQVAHLCHLLNARPAFLQESKSWTVGGAETISRDTVATFRQRVVDQVDPDLLEGTTPLAIVHVCFDPFIGRRADGSYDAAQHEKHDRYLKDAKWAVDAAARGEEGGEQKGLRTMQMCTTTVQLCFSATLGMHGAAAFQTNRGLYEEALKQPSQQMRLIWRMLRDRQLHGRTRIVVYSPSATMLELLRNQLAVWGGCGKLYLYTGRTTSTAKRDGMIGEFLGQKATSRGVLLISGAGAIGTTICPGCETLFVVGDVPWTKAELCQAESRVRRLTQTQPVEIVRFVPLRSVVSGKYRVHACEAARLYEAVEHGNFENFKRDKSSQWKLRESITADLAPLDALGNYCAKAEAADAPVPVLADDFELPPVSFPVDGFVEAPCADDVAFDDDGDGAEDSSSESRKRAREGDDGDASGAAGV